MSSFVCHHIEQDDQECLIPPLGSNKTCLQCFQVVITSYEMMMRLTCNGCCKGGPSLPGSRGPCLGPQVRQTHHDGV